MSQTSQPVSIEVALNGGYDRATQPNVPVLPEEIIEDAVRCHEAGAAIIHFHCFDRATGKQRYDAEIYGEVIRGIRARCDAIAYATLPMISGADGGFSMNAEARNAAPVALARAGLAEWWVCDTGSINFMKQRDYAAGRNGVVYLNPVEYLREQMKMFAECDFRPTMGIWDFTFLRLGLRLHRDYLPGKRPMLKFFFSEGMLQGARPRAYALDAYLEALKEEAPDAYWTIAAYETDLSELAPRAIAAGGNLRVGLEDAPSPSPFTNAELVRQAAELIRRGGRTVATPADVRDAI